METGFLTQITLSLVSFYNSPFFAFLKFIIGIYVAVIFVDIILLLILKGLGSDFRTMIKGMNMPAASKSATQKKWNKIKHRLRSDSVSQYKVAILEADIVIDKVLSSMGLPGKNMTERLEKAKPAQIPGYEELKAAHLIRNRIIHEANFEVNREKAGEIIAVYENLLKNLELL